MNKGTFVFILAVICWIFGLWVGRTSIKPQVIDSQIIVHDTIEKWNVKYKTKYITRTVIKELPVYDTVYKDSVKTVFVEIPIHQYHFEEDSLYSLDVEGYEVSLKNIKVFPKTIYRTQTVTNKTKNRFGLGFQAGYGIAGNKPVPYLGIGISYNLLSF